MVCVRYVDAAVACVRYVLDAVDAESPAASVRYVDAADDVVR